MNVLIISTNRSAHPMPVMPMGSCIVAEAAERAGHTVRLLDLMFEKDPVSAAESGLRVLKPDIIGLSVRNIDNNDMRDTVFFINDLLPLVTAIRMATDAPIVLGGAALSVMPNEILRASGVSYGVMGDGEIVFPEFLDRLSRRTPFADLAGLAYRDNDVFRKNSGAVNFSDECPVPDYRRWLNLRAYRSRLSTAPVQTKLGCPFQCVYCTYRKIEGSTYRLSDPENAANAVVGLSKSGLRDIEFVDSVFNAPYDHAAAVCQSLARKNHGARLQSIEFNPLYIDDALLTVMERAGFVGIGITADSASEPVLRGLRKGFTAQEVHHAAEVVRRHRLPCVWMFLLGGPGETCDTVRETLRFAENCIRPQDAVFFNVGIRIYPRTELESIARAQGVLATPHEEMLAPVFYVSPEVGAEWMREQLKRSMISRMNFISSDSIGHSLLPAIQRIGYRLGLRSPLWRHTRFIRRGLRLMGMEV